MVLRLCLFGRRFVSNYKCFYWLLVFALTKRDHSKIMKKFSAWFNISFILRLILKGAVSRFALVFFLSCVLIFIVYFTVGERVHNL